MKTLDEEGLLDLKKQIEKSKSKISELTGQKTALLNQLKNDWDCNSIEDAESKLAAMKKSIAKLGEQISTATEELEGKLKEEEDE
jgi:glutamine synthetase type III